MDQLDISWCRATLKQIQAKRNKNKKILTLTSKGLHSSEEKTKIISTTQHDRYSIPGLRSFHGDRIDNNNDMLRIIKTWSTSLCHLSFTLNCKRIEISREFNKQPSITVLKDTLPLLPHLITLAICFSGDCPDATVTIPSLPKLTSLHLKHGWANTISEHLQSRLAAMPLIDIDGDMPSLQMLRIDSLTPTHSTSDKRWLLPLLSHLIILDTTPGMTSNYVMNIIAASRTSLVSLHVEQRLLNLASPFFIPQMIPTLTHLHLRTIRPEAYHPNVSMVWVGEWTNLRSLYLIDDYGESPFNYSPPWGPADTYLRLATLTKLTSLVITSKSPQNAIWHPRNRDTWLPRLVNLLYPPSSSSPASSSTPTVSSSLRGGVLRYVNGEPCDKWLCRLVNGTFPTSPKDGRHEWNIRALQRLALIAADVAAATSLQASPSSVSSFSRGEHTLFNNHDMRVKQSSFVTPLGGRQLRVSPRQRRYIWRLLHNNSHTNNSDVDDWKERKQEAIARYERRQIAKVIGREVRAKRAQLNSKKKGKTESTKTESKVTTPTLENRYIRTE
jgi:hypothetical protein